MKDKTLSITVRKSTNDMAKRIAEKLDDKIQVVYKEAVLVYAEKVGVK